MRDTFATTFECEDCGRDDHLSISAMLNCPCNRLDRNGYPHLEPGYDI